MPELNHDDTILVVDDDNLVRLGIMMTLKENGYTRCFAAKNGAAAVELARQHAPVVILMDVRLGTGIDGIQAADIIREEHPCRVVFLTGSNEIETRSRIEQARPAAFLTKPILPHIIIHTLDNLKT